MKLISPIFVLLMLLLSHFAIAGEIDNFTSALSEDAAYRIGEAYQLSGLSSVVTAKAGEKLNKLLQSKLQEISADAFASAAQKLLKSGKCKVSETKISVNQLNNEIANSSILREEIKNNLKSRLKDWLPEVSRKILYEDVFQGEIMSNSKIREVVEMEEKIVSALDTTLNEKMDEMGNVWYARIVQDLNQLLNPCDSGFCRKLDITIDVTDLKKTFNSAFKLKNLDTFMSLSLSDAFGKSTVAGIRSRIETALNGELPPEAVQYLKMGPEKFAEYADKIKSNLPGAQLDKLKGKLLGMPLVTLPNGAYGGILTGVAAAHYAKGIAGCPLSCNWYEINRGREVTKVLIWQLKNKRGVTLTVGSFLDFAKEVTSKYGLGEVGAFAKIQADFSKFSYRIKKIEELADKIDKMTSASLDKVQGAIGEAVGQIQGELLKLQSELVKPIKDATDTLAGGFQDVQNSFAGLLGDFNGLPKKIDIPDELFGKLGDINPVNKVKEMFDKSGIESGVKDILSGLNEKVSDGIATLGSNVLYETGILGPKAEIKDGEKIPFHDFHSKEDEDNIFDPVYLHNGEFYLKNSDLFIPGVGMSFEFVRIYKSRSDFPGPVGYNWTHNYAERLMPWKDSPEGPGITWVDPLGRKYFFKKVNDEFVSPSGVFYKLSVISVEDGFLMISPEGDKTFFDRYGFLKRKGDLFGNEIRFIYDRNSKITAVIDTLGRKIGFYYDDIGRIIQIKDFAGRELKYSYDDLGNLIEATSPEGRQIRYRYSFGKDDVDLNHNLTMIMDPKGDVYLKNKYGKAGPNNDKVVEQIYGEGLNKIRAEYRKISDGGEITDRVWVTDGRNIVHVFDYNKFGNMLNGWIVNPSGNVEMEVDHDYDDNGLRVKTTYPSGRRVFRKYENGNLILWKVCGGSCRTAEFQYNQKFNKITSFVDFSGLKRGYEYGKRGELIKEINSDGSFISREYNDNGQIVSKINEVGVVERYDYYNDGRARGYLKSVTQDAGGVGAIITYEYDIVGNVVDVTDPSDHKKEFLLNLDNQPLKDDRARYFYNDNGNLVRIIVGNNESEYLFEYDILDRPVSKHERIGKDDFIETRYRYDPSGNIVGLIYPEGNGIFYKYDYKNRPFKIIKGDSKKYEEVGIGYNADGGITEIVNGDGEKFRYEYDDLGELSAVVNPSGTKKVYDRDASGRIKAIRFFDNQNDLLSETALEYDLNGLAKLVKKRLWRDDPADSKWIEYKTVRDSIGRVIEEIAPRGEVTKYFYNGLDLVTKMVDPENRSTLYHYNKDGLLIKEERAIDKGNSSIITYGYDNRDRLGEIVDQGGNRTLFEYDMNDNLTKRVDPRGFFTKYEYDDIGRRTGLFQEIGKDLLAETHYEWDRNGRLKSIKDANGNKTEYEYDSLNRLTGEKFADDKTIGYSYDKIGRLLEFHDQNGTIIKYSFNPLNQIQKREIIRGDGVSGTTLQKFIYDPLGRLIYSLDDNNPEIKDDDLEVWYSYDSLSRRVGENQNGKWFAYNYDESDNKTAVIYPSGYLHYKGYDKNNRLRAIYNSDLSIKFNYNWLDRPTEIYFSDRLKSVQHYDKLDRLVDKKFNYKSKTVAGWSYLYDETGNLISESDIKERTKKLYDYDGLERIPPKESSLDKLGNMMDDNTSVDATNRYLSINGERLGYDKNGNLVGDGELNYLYDGLNRLVVIADRDKRPIVSYVYDAHNRRAGKNIIEKGTEKFFYDGWNLAEEYDNSTYKSYIYGNSIDDILTSVSEGDRNYFITDKTGSVRSVIDYIGKELVSYTYDIYGEIISTSGRVENNLGYLGREYDEESGLLYLRNRYYSPKLKRFITPDPLGFKNSFYSSSTIIEPVSISYHDGLMGGFNSGLPFDVATSLGFSTRPNQYSVADLNLYQFVLSNPLKYFDPMGLWVLYVDLNPDRSVEGGWTLVNNLGARMDGGRALGRGQHRDWNLRNGDTPTGIFRYDGQRAPQQSGPACGVTQCGSAERIVMTPVAGNALVAANTRQPDGGGGRSGLLIHEGRVNEFLATGRLQRTHGCVRLSHNDLTNLNNLIDSLSEQGDRDGTIYVGEFTDPPMRGIDLVNRVYSNPYHIRY